MKEYLYIHPVGQLFSFLFGLFNFITGHTRKAFNISIHLNCGLLYYFSTSIGAGIGYLLSNWASKENYDLDMLLHGYLAMIMIFLFVMGATTGFILMKDNENKERILKYHKIINGFSLVVFIILGISGLFEISML
jgi:heme/copper-type cytochrome/quinol oxidase subunit 2